MLYSNYILSNVTINIYKRKIGDEEVNQILSQAINLRKIGKHVESNKLMLELINVFPENPNLNYQCAWSFDLLGEEEKAVPFYIKAIDFGLTGRHLEGALIGLGSTYRTLGKYQESKKVLLKGIDLFPTNNAMKTFLL